MPSPPASCPRPRQLAHAGVTSASPFLCADVHEFLYAPTIFDPATSESWQPARIAAAARGHPATACRQACTAIRQLALPTNALAWPQPSHLLMRPVYPAALIFCRQVHVEGRPGGAHAPPPLPRHLAAAARLPSELPAGCCLRLCSRLHTRPPPPHPPRRKHRSAPKTGPPSHPGTGCAPHLPSLPTGVCWRRRRVQRPHRGAVLAALPVQGATPRHQLGAGHNQGVCANS